MEKYLYKGEDRMPIGLMTPTTVEVKVEEN